MSSKSEAFICIIMGLAIGYGASWMFDKYLDIKIRTAILEGVKDGNLEQ